MPEDSRYGGMPHDADPVAAPLPAPSWPQLLPPPAGVADTGPCAGTTGTVPSFFATDGVFLPWLAARDDRKAAFKNADLVALRALHTGVLAVEDVLQALTAGARHLAGDACPLLAAAATDAAAAERSAEPVVPLSPASSLLGRPAAQRGERQTT